ncbi:hypothetical protein DRJ25_01025 [Candidatus Woesearchaeota archaeon]|nr:MAG: hypothetical protein DRJ25_01025 [Candidatus Woesearchaeota archaeon]
MEFSEIYEPREDSYFMQRYVLKFAKGNVLDMGTGSGILALTALKKKSVKSVVGVDISEKAIKHCRKLSRKVIWIRSDLFDKLGRKYLKFFDTIFFNPPYLPQEGKKRIRTIEGGKRGFELCNRFLEQARPFLKDNGRIFLLFSSLSHPDFILNFADTMLYSQKLVAVKSLFFEELFIYRFEKSKVLVELESKGIRNIKFFDKGWRGLISTGKYKCNLVAIKTKRPYSEAKTAIRKEAKWLKFVNKHGLGPKFVMSGKGFLVYRFVDGKPFKDWIVKASKSSLKKAVLKILDKCFMLDKLKVNKEEMHRPLTNVLVTKDANPVLIDFERMYKTRKPHNVTQFCQFLISNEKLFRKKGFGFTKAKIISAASRYKSKAGSFDDIKGLIR